MAPSVYQNYKLLDDELFNAFSPIIKEESLHQNAKKEVDDGHRVQIVWRNVYIFLYIHVASFFGMYYFLVYAQWKTLIYTCFLSLFTSQGIGPGVHRLWAHRAYKANLPLRIILCILQTFSLQNSIYEWCRDHRGHHKYSDTNADPHNSTRGFFFSHMGWLFCKKHKDVIEKGKTLDLSDLEADPVVMFQKKYYLILGPLFGFIIPAWIPWFFWNENIHVSWCVCSMLRYALSLHGTWLINSAGHSWGTKPFDKNIMATQNATIAYITNGEGWHNYHHVFPWDYRASELGSYSGNGSTAFIDFFAKIGWAYDLKIVSDDMIKKRVLRTGDGSKTFDDLGLETKNFWGWGDEDMKKEDVCLAEVRKNRTIIG